MGVFRFRRGYAECTVQPVGRVKDHKPINGNRTQSFAFAA